MWERCTWRAGPARRCLLVIALVLYTAAPSLALDNLPDLGDYSATILSRIEEERLGREFMRSARGQLDYLDDPELNGYVDRLGQRLVKNSDTPDEKFHFYVIRDKTLNAFAVPGGHISVHTGLILAAQHEGELASVLAHEIAHITQHHLARMVASTQNQGLAAMAAILAAVVLGGPAGQAALLATNAGLIERQLKFSRTFEREADSLGIRTLARADFDPRAMPAFFERLEQWSRIYDSEVPEFLRTHPLTSDRIAESVARADQYPKVPNPDESGFQHMRARIRALFDTDANSAVQSFAARLEDPKLSHRDAQLYGYALALGAAGRYAEAREQVDDLLRAHPDDLRYQLARGQLEMAAGQYAAAVEAFEQTYQSHPKDPMVELYFANTLVKTGRYSDAKTVIKRALLNQPDSPTLYALLARAEGETGNQLAAHQALAEHFYLRGNSREALRQLSLAKRYVNDSFYARASVEARIQEITQEMDLAGERPPDPEAGTGR